MVEKAMTSGITFETLC